MNYSINYVFGSELDTIIKKIKDKVNKVYTDMAQIIQAENKRQVFSMYFLYPYLFKDSFDIFDEGTLIDLSVLSVLCLDSCLYDDKILDEQEQVTPLDHHLHNLRNIEIGRLLQKYSYDSECFWKYYYKYYEEYVKATTLERNFYFGKINDYDWDNFFLIAKGKQAMCKIVPAMLCVLVNDFTMLKDYESAIDRCSVAMQLYDDLRDWKDDFKSKHISYLLNKIIIGGNFSLNTDLSEISGYLFDKKIDTEVLYTSNRLLDEALVFSRYPLSPVFIRYIRFTQNFVNKLMMDMMKIRGQHFISYEYLYQNPNGAKVTLEKKILNETFRFIQKQYEKGLLELKEWMICQNPDQQKKDEILSGDIFMRAQILNLLLDVSEIDEDAIKCILEMETKSFMEQQSKIYKYGWVYVDGLYGNCPDLDTFSEILRISLNSRNTNTILKEKVLQILSVIMNLNSEQKHFSTWIIDEDEPNYEFIEQNLTMMGDLEVTANFIKALISVNQEEYKEVINDCLMWIIDKQNNEGYWLSTWYIGNYYCGYVLSSLAKEGVFSIAFERYLNYVYKTQNPNGSWGDGSGNPLETSYVLMSILAYEDLTLGNIKEVINRGAKYLLLTRMDEGYWLACEFIKMGEGKTDISKQHLRYKSVTLTTVYCFTALSKVIRSLERE